MALQPSREGPTLGCRGRQSALPAVPRGLTTGLLAILVPVWFPLEEEGQHQKLSTGS